MPPPPHDLSRISAHLVEGQEHQCANFNPASSTCFPLHATAAPYHSLHALQGRCYCHTSLTEVMDAPPPKSCTNFLQLPLFLHIAANRPPTLVAFPPPRPLKQPPLSPYGTAAIPPSSVAAYPRPPLPPDASSTLYVECLPPDITEREVAHIFRRFEGQGYQSIRVFPKEGKSGPLLL